MVATQSHCYDNAQLFPYGDSVAIIFSFGSRFHYYRFIIIGKILLDIIGHYCKDIRVMLLLIFHERNCAYFEIMFLGLSYQCRKNDVNSVLKT